MGTCVSAEAANRGGSSKMVYVISANEIARMKKEEEVILKLISLKLKASESERQLQRRSKISPHSRYNTVPAAPKIKI